MTSYKTCTVPMCRSTTIKCPNKLFIHVPKNPERRKQWLQLARRDPQFTSEKSVIFFCEDHFDLPNDMENYFQYSIMGSIGKIRIKPDCLPSKFNCQPDRIKRTGPPQPQSALENDMDNNIEYKIMGSVKQIRMKPNCLPSRFDCRKRKFTERKPRAAPMKRQRMSIIKEIEEAENKASDTRLPSSIQDPASVSKETTTYEEEISVKLEPDSEVEPEPSAPEPRPTLCCCCLERAPALPLWPGEDGEQLGRMILSCLQLDLSAFPCAMVCLSCAEAARRARSFRQQVARCQQRLMQGPADYGVPVMDNSSASPYVNIADDTLTVVKSEPPDEWSAERDLKADPLKEEELSTAKVEPSEDDPLEEHLVVFSEEDQYTPGDMQDDTESVEVEYLEMEFLDEDEETETERRLEVSEEGRKEVCVQSTATDIVSSQRSFRKADDTGNTASDTGQKAGEEITIRWLTK